jgi:kynurenine formamidase
MTASTSPAAIEALVAALDGLDAVDLSPTLRSHMPRFFAHPEFHVIGDARTIEHDQYRLQTLVLPEHVGAHVDAPAHVQAERPEATIDTVAATALWGRAVVVDASARDWQPGELWELDDFMGAVADRGAALRAGDVVLVHFGWNRHLADGARGVPYWSANAPGFTEALCRELHDLGVRAVGSDSPTCDMAWVAGEPTAAFGHLQYFLPNDIYILECLEALERLPPVVYFAALPLKTEGGTGSPLRPVAFVPRR